MTRLPLLLLFFACAADKANGTHRSAMALVKNCVNACVMPLACVDECVEDGREFCAQRGVLCSREDLWDQDFIP